MALFTHLLFVAGYALAALALGFALPRVMGMAVADGFVAGALVFIVAALVHEVMMRRFGERALVSVVQAVQRNGAENTADLDGARREIARLRADLARAGEAQEKRIDAELGVIKTVLGQVARFMEERAAAHADDKAGTALFDLLGDDLARAIEAAIEHSRVDLLLQPIVSLPQRKVRFYETYSRLRQESGRPILPEQYMPIAEKSGLIAAIDNGQLFRTAQLVRKLKQRNGGKAFGFFCNVSPRSLADDSFFEQFANWLAAEGDLAESIVFEFAADDILARDAATDAKLVRLARLGFRFSLDQVTRLDFDPEELARRHIRYVKLDANRLVAQDHPANSNVQLADLKAAFAAAGIDLIAEKIESERMLVDLLDYEFDYGQGYLFGEPKLARDDPALGQANRPAAAA